MSRRAHQLVFSLFALLVGGCSTEHTKMASSHAKAVVGQEETSDAQVPPHETVEAHGTADEKLLAAGPSGLETIKDERLRAAVSAWLQQVGPEVNPVGLDDMKELKVECESVSTLEGIEDLTNLETVVLSSAKLTDIAPLAACTKLKLLVLNGNAITDVAPLAKLSALEELYLGGNPIADIGPLAQLPKLKSLDLSQTQVADLSALTRFPALEKVALTGAPVTDLAPLLQVPHLSGVGVSQERIDAKDPMLDQLKAKGVAVQGFSSVPNDPCNP